MRTGQNPIQTLREQRAVTNTDVRGLARRVTVCRTVVHPSQTNTVAWSWWLKITTPETIGTQETHKIQACMRRKTHTTDPKQWELPERAHTSSSMSVCVCVCIALFVFFGGQLSQRYKEILHDLFCLHPVCELMCACCCTSLSPLSISWPQWLLFTTV